MRNFVYIIIGLIITMLLFQSCEPDVAGEGVSLNPISLPFKVNPNKDSIRINDTVLISSSIPNEYNLKQGILEIKFNIVFSDSIPTTNADQTKEVYNSIDYLLINEKGSIVYNSGVEGLILGLNVIPSGDSIRLKYKFVPYKKGLYTMGFSSSFYIGEKEKARTNAYFDVANHYWNYYQVPNQDLPDSLSEDYKRYYFVAVV